MGPEGFEPSTKRIQAQIHGLNNLVKDRNTESWFST